MREVSGLFLSRAAGAVAIVAVVLFAAGCGGGGTVTGGGGGRVIIPSIASLQPSSVAQNSPSQNVAIHGANFASGATVMAGATAVTPTFVNSDELDVTLPASMLTSPGAIGIRVTNPDGHASGTSSFDVVGASAVTATTHPLVAKYTINIPSSADVEVQFGETTGYGRSTNLVPTPSSGGTVNILVAGMKASTLYHMRAVAHFPDSSTFTDSDQTFTTGAIDPAKLPAITVDSPGTPNPGVELVDINTSALGPDLYDVVVTDLSGNVIWFYDHPPSDGTTFPAKFLPNGDLITVNNVILGDGTPGNNGVLRETDLIGNIVREVDVATMKTRMTNAGLDPALYNGPHHDVVLLPSGDFIVFSHYGTTFNDVAGTPSAAPDTILLLDANWNPKWVWDSAAHLDHARAPFGYPDWTHCNGLAYSPVDHDIIVSCRNQSLVYKIDFRDGTGTGNVLWRLGNGGDFTLLNGAVADWNYAQHNPGYFGDPANDVLAMWDNGNNRVMDAFGHLCGTSGQPACYSRGVAFQLDEFGKTATIVFDHRPGQYAGLIGSIQLLANGNVTDDAGASNGFNQNANVYEVTNTASPQLVWHMNVNGSYVYRANRIPSLYPGVQW